MVLIQIRPFEPTRPLLNRFLLGRIVLKVNFNSLSDKADGIGESLRPPKLCRLGMPGLSDEVQWLGQVSAQVLEEFEEVLWIDEEPHKWCGVREGVPLVDLCSPTVVGDHRKISILEFEPPEAPG